MLWTKVIVSVVLFATTLGATLSMLTLMGRREKTMSVGALKAVHRIAGWLTVVLALVNGYLGARFVAMVGDGMTIRAALHGLLALGLLSALVIKLLIVKRFKQYLSFAPTLGMLVFALMLIVIATSTGFYFVRAFCGPGDSSELDDFVELVAPGDVGDAGDMAAEAVAEAAGGVVPDVVDDVVDEHTIARGRAEYMGHCAGCHPTDPDANGYGPMLPGFFDREVIASSGAPITDASVRAQILAPGGTMPAFEGRLDDDEVDEIIAYMKTL